MLRYRWWRGGVDGRVSSLRPFIVTGPSRSGTSLMTALLNRLPNAVAINEPPRLFAHRLGAGAATDQLRSFIIDTANDAVRRHSVLNKTDDEAPRRLSTDTFHSGQSFHRVPVTVRPDAPLAVGVKATLPFVEHLHAFCAEWPELRAVVMLRDPIATIRSQRQTFGWQQAAPDPRSGRYQFSMLRAVDPNADALTMRAQFWAASVERVVEAVRQWPEQVRIVRYERLLEQPARVLGAIAEFVGLSDVDVNRIDLTDVKPRNRRGQYDDFSVEEMASITACTRSSLEAADALALSSHLE